MVKSHLVNVGVIIGVIIEEAGNKPWLATDLLTESPWFLWTLVNIWSKSVRHQDMSRCSTSSMQGMHVYVRSKGMWDTWGLLCRDCSLVLRTLVCNDECEISSCGCNQKGMGMAIRKIRGWRQGGWPLELFTRYSWMQPCEYVVYRAIIPCHKAGATRACVMWARFYSYFLYSTT